ncbi:hypothetical protein [Nonomuraea basaltis]|uniref:hypothetical protein n=1 Tax=Nonomuraea basaltis TaxID=2495887 RepID=UPI00110C58DE|nr:hypothetical protein [Nonomuraea basaltis]TMS00625.1 hypothetical protein EJK15_01395 [Nonomuraea basaltis]
MSDQFEDTAERPVERGGSEEAARTPVTPAEEESSRRPADVTPDATPDFDESDVPFGADLDEFDAAFMRSKELNPDDFE